MASADLSGLTRLQARLAVAANPDYETLMVAWERIIDNDNQRGLLAGTDRHGNRLADLAPSTLANRKGSGGPLVPRGASSRFIANLRTAHGKDGSNWVALGAWENVLSKRGTPFVPFHLQGAGRLPQRDVGGVRPQGMREAKEALRTWYSGQLR